MAFSLNVKADSDAGRLIASPRFQDALKSILGDGRYAVTIGHWGGMMNCLRFDHAVAIEAIPRSFQTAASLLHEEDRSVLDELRRMAGYYTRDEVEPLIRWLVTAAWMYPVGSPEVEEVIYAHPWTMKYLSYFAEADRFRDLAKHADVTVSVGQEEELYREMRRKSGLAQQLLASVSSETAGKRKQVFCFQELPDGFYLPLNR